jgi:hypothetical protein
LRGFDQPDEGSDRNTRRPLGLKWSDGIFPRRPRYIEMGPFGLVDKFLDKHRSHDRARLAARTDILDVGNIRFDLLTVFLAKRELPKSFAGIFAEIDYRNWLRIGYIPAGRMACSR